MLPSCGRCADQVHFAESRVNHLKSAQTQRARRCVHALLSNLLINAILPQIGTPVVKVSCGNPQKHLMLTIGSSILQKASIQIHHIIRKWGDSLPSTNTAKQYVWFRHRYQYSSKTVVKFSTYVWFQPTSFPRGGAYEIQTNLD
jgi:hypothetical protein